MKNNAPKSSKGLIVILTIAFLFETVFALAGFLMPEKVLEISKLQINQDTLFLGYALAWLLAFVAIICGWAIKLVRVQNPAGWALSKILGWWWVGIGLALFFVWHKTENLFQDTLKGLIILWFAYKSEPKK